MKRNTNPLFLALSTAMLFLIGCTQAELDDPQKPDNPSTPEEQEKNIVSRIQYISYVPRYADGKARMSYTDDGAFIPGTAELTFEIQPSSVAEEIVKDYSSAVSVNAVYSYATKSDIISLSIDDIAAKDGYITIVVNGNNLKEEYFKSQCIANIRFRIAVEDEEKASDYIQMIAWNADAVLFSDDNFKSFCVKNFDKNGDGEISKYEAGLVTEIKCAEAGFTSLEGIEYFENLTYLDASANKLTILDVSHNTKLTELRVNNNSLRELVLGDLPDLTVLDCSDNRLETLDVSAAKSLRMLNCSNNKIVALDINNCTVLESLNCSNNNLMALDISHNKVLVELNCAFNSGMTTIYVNDISQEGELSVTKDENAVFLCKNIYFPDANLKSYLVEKFDADKDGEISFSEAENIKQIDCSSRGIMDLTGIQECVNLEDLDVSSTTITQLDLSHNLQLAELNVSGTKLTSLDVSQNTLLKVLDISDTAIEMIDLKSADSLVDLNISNTSVAKLDVSNHSQLERINIVNAPLTELNISGTKLSALDVSTNTVLISLNVLETAISRLDLSHNLQLAELNVSGTKLTSLDVSQNTLLKVLDISDTAIEMIDLKSADSLVDLNISNTSVAKLDVSNHSQLERINIVNAPLTELNISGTKLSALDVSTNTVLISLNVLETAISELNVSHNTSLAILEVSKTVKLRVSTGLKASIYQVGQYVSIDGVTGIVYETLTPAIVSTDETSTTWGYYGTFMECHSTTDGAANTDKIASGSSAAKWCRAKGSKWYLPAKSELATIYNNKSTLNETLSAIGGTTLYQKYYWSSTEFANTAAYSISFYDGHVLSDYGSYKNDSKYVRAVRAIMYP